MLSLCAAGAAALSSCAGRPERPRSAAGRRLLVLGIDGMDPVLLRQLMEAGRMPNFARLAARGSFSKLATSMPPQSPVAWSNFISGAGPGRHQIYDFIHRDPNPDAPGLAVRPYLSTSRTVPPPGGRSISLGRWRIPLGRGRTVSLRRGDSFWDHLVRHGVKTVVYRVPANYPPPAPEGRAGFYCLCGMGTPDVLGTYGEFTVFTPEAPLLGRRVGGGRFVHLSVVDDRATALLEGPGNFLRKPDARGEVPPMTVRLEITRDPTEKVAKIAVGQQLLLLNEREWSDWVPIGFKTGLPGSALLGALGLRTALPAMVRFMFRQIHPRLELYVSPPNIDPRRPLSPISTPPEFSRQLAAACGPYYTTGIPEDSQALRHGALDEQEYLSQVGLLLQERRREYRYALEHFDRGVLFYYFGHTDQVAHLFWRDRDPEHPGRVPAQAARYATVIEDMYAEMDELLGEALAGLDEDDVLIVLSDHGFTTFRRGFNLNTWLLRNGYLSVSGALAARGELGLADVDWSRTRAYALGLNSLYLNLRGREKRGIVAPGRRRGLLEEIAEKLLRVRDTNGARVIEKVYFTGRIYPGADPALAPDLLIGYARGYRASWATALGGIRSALTEDNRDRWSGTHLVADHLVPGIFLANRKLVCADPALSDIAPTILSAFGIEKPPGMIGRPLLDLAPKAAAASPAARTRAPERQHAVPQDQNRQGALRPHRPAGQTVGLLLGPRVRRPRAGARTGPAGGNRERRADRAAPAWPGVHRVSGG